jgi:hypothetical protein
LNFFIPGLERLERLETQDGLAAAPATVQDDAPPKPASTTSDRGEAATTVAKEDAGGS